MRWTMIDEEEEEQKKTRTQLKRDHAELKMLSKQLMELTPKQLKNLNVSEDTLDATLAAKKLVRGSARQRMIRRLTRLIEEEDIDTLRSTLSDSNQSRTADGTALQEVERWRDELIAGDDQVLNRFIEEHPTFDRQHMRQLTQNARKELELEKTPKSARRLFLYLKSMSNDA